MSSVWIAPRSTALAIDKRRTLSSCERRYQPYRLSTDRCNLRGDAPQGPSLYPVMAMAGHGNKRAAYLIGKLEYFLSSFTYPDLTGHRGFGKAQAGADTIKVFPRRSFRRRSCPVPEIGRSPGRRSF